MGGTGVGNTAWNDISIAQVSKMSTTKSKQSSGDNLVGKDVDLLACISLALLRYSFGLLPIARSLYWAGLWQLARDNGKLSRCIFNALIDYDNYCQEGNLDASLTLEGLRSKSDSWLTLSDYMKISSSWCDQSRISNEDGASNSSHRQMVNQARQWLLEALLERENGLGSHENHEFFEEIDGQSNQTGRVCLLTGIPITNRNEDAAQSLGQAFGYTLEVLSTKWESFLELAQTSTNKTSKTTARSKSNQKFAEIVEFMRRLAS